MAACSCQCYLYFRVTGKVLAPRSTSAVTAFTRPPPQVGTSQTKITHAKIIQPKLVKEVDPIYPPEAATRNAVGTVRVYYVIGGDGLVYNAHAISGEGLSEDPSLRKAAEEAVLQWRYEPGTFDGKPFQTTVTPDITFRPTK
jgi:TonB family protein